MEELFGFLFPLVIGALVTIALKLFFTRPFKNDTPYDEPPSNWISTNGRVYISRAELLHEKSSGYRPEIGCVYLVNGKSHSTLMRLPKHIRFSSKDDVENFLTDYPKGFEVTVYYQPDNPEKAFAIPQK